MVLLPFFTLAQNTFPDFSFANIQINVPTSMAYLQDDSIKINGNNLVYNLNGQIYNIDNGEGHIQTTAEGFSGFTDRSTPWKTLTELLAAYQNNDFNAVKSLFTTAGQDSIENFLPTPADISQYMEQSSTIVWNIGTHCMYDPQPVLTPSLIAQPDTIYAAYDTLGNSLPSQINIMEFQMNIPGNYLSFFVLDEDLSRGYVLIRIQEGSSLDINSASGIFSFEISGEGFLEGDLTLYAVESNYLIDGVTQEMIDNALEFSLNVSIDFQTQ